MKGHSDRFQVLEEKLSSVMKKYPGSNSRKSNRKTNLLIREVIQEGDEEDENDEDDEEDEEEEEDVEDEFQQYKQNLETERRNDHYEPDDGSITEAMLARARGDKVPDIDEVE